MNLERLLKAAGQKVGGSKPILEVNVHHPLVQSLDKQSERGRFRDWCLILFDQALLAEGRPARRSGHLREAAERVDALARAPRRGAELKRRRCG
jgi:HSP90 family molecular chaperone